MDKNTITGLVLIGILLVGFSFLSRPSEEQIAAQKDTTILSLLYNSRKRH